ncbi:hypothetical protein DPMN_114704 [Dreissena polymorpha]|uniref:DIS3-like exonuclease 1 n=1 Tax=Dreissena polymorpha TaxID=45954 RepID=A0A9D4QT44_DREPO|nr:hypothetical protein DPMN_114704 [Dreissena polymorpha]
MISIQLKELPMSPEELAARRDLRESHLGCEDVDDTLSCRSTTVYLADRRYDMLPGILSANLCSLICGIGLFWSPLQLDTSLELVDVWYGRTIIRSQYKLFYEVEIL